MTKISIVGVGEVGALCVTCLAECDFVNEITLVGVQTYIKKIMTDTLSIYQIILLPSLIGAKAVPVNVNGIAVVTILETVALGMEKEKRVSLISFHPSRGLCGME